MNNQFKQRLGESGEVESVRFLLSQGFTIHQTNFHSPYGEIDIIAIKDETIHFIEVKTRSGDHESAFSSISLRKQKKLLKTASYFLSKFPELQDYFTQFDAIAISIKNNKLSVKIIYDAFRDNF